MKISTRKLTCKNIALIRTAPSKNKTKVLEANGPEQFTMSWIRLIVNKKV